MGTARRAELAMAGKVVANCWAVFGLPLTVTVGTPLAGLGLDVAVPDGVEEASRMAKREDVACMTPWVELMKMRK